MTKFAFVDVLRGIAILMVIIVHHGQKFSAIGDAYYVVAFGQMGVQLFFVASAFTLCHSATSRGSGEHPTRDFLIRRFFRIAPLYYLAVPLYYVLYRYVKHEGYEVYTPLNVALNFAFLQSFNKEAMNSIVPGGWSIGTEMMFYLAFPVLFASISRLIEAKRWLIVAAMPLLVTLASAMIWTFTPIDRGLMYYGLLNQLPVFLVGILTYFVVQAGWEPAVRRDLPLVLLFGGLAFIVFLGSYVPTMQRLCEAFLPLSAALCYVFVLNLARVYASTAVARILAKIGQASYSIYIFHFIFAWPVSQRIVGAFGGGVTAQAALYFPTLILTISASYLVAQVSKRVIEDPAINLGKQLIALLNSRASKVAV